MILPAKKMTLTFEVPGPPDFPLPIREIRKDFTGLKVSSKTVFTGLGYKQLYDQLDEPLDDPLVERITALQFTFKVCGPELKLKFNPAQQITMLAEIHNGRGHKKERIRMMCYLSEKTESQDKKDEYVYTFKSGAEGV